MSTDYDITMVSQTATYNDMSTGNNMYCAPMPGIFQQPENTKKIVFYENFQCKIMTGQPITPA